MIGVMGTYQKRYSAEKGIITLFWNFYLAPIDLAFQFMDYFIGVTLMMVSFSFKMSINIGKLKSASLKCCGIC
jgi:hypothetical protein